MEWIGTHFTITLGGIRLNVNIALEDTPDERPARPAREPRADPPHHLNVDRVRR